MTDSAEIIKKLRSGRDTVDMNYAKMKEIAGENPDIITQFLKNQSANKDEYFYYKIFYENALYAKKIETKLTKVLSNAVNMGFEADLKAAFDDKNYTVWQVLKSENPADIAKAVVINNASFFASSFGGRKSRKSRKQRKQRKSRRTRR